MKIARQAFQLIVTFFHLVQSNLLHIRKNHLWEKYELSDGKTYSVFRETISDKNYHEKEVTIIIGFRLKLIGSNPFFHFLFQKICVLNTPIWVGFKGFRKKFWMVDLKTKDYAGLYQYQGRENAQKYVDYITAVLKPLSTKGSVWSEIVDTSFEHYTEKRKIIV